MLISHRHKFIFIHCRKVAGSSIKVLLSRHLGATDILIGCHQARAEHGVRPNLQFFADVLRPASLRHYARRRLRGTAHLPAVSDAAKYRYRALLGRDPLHPPATVARSVFPAEWDGYFKFCFVRNPFERAVSDYFFTQGPSPELTFLEFLEQLEESRPNNLIDNWGLYTIDDIPEAGFIGRYENLREDIKEVLKVIGLSWNGELPHVKRAKPYDYRSFYGSQETDIARRLYEREIDYCGYSL